MAVLFLLTGKWFAGALHASLAVYNVRRYLRGDATLDVTEIFNQVGREKTVRMVKLIFYLLSFVLIIYRCGPYCALIRYAGRSLVLQTALEMFGVCSSRQEVSWGRGRKQGISIDTKLSCFGCRMVKHIFYLLSFVLIIYRCQL
jgi:hypothetical protein